MIMDAGGGLVHVVPNEGSLLTNISILGEALPQNFFDTFAVYSVADEPVTNSDSRR